MLVFFFDSKSRTIVYAGQSNKKKVFHFFTEDNEKPLYSNHFLNFLIIARASAHLLVIADQSLAFIISAGNKFDPIPTHVTPALTQAERFSSVGSLPLT